MQTILVWVLVSVGGQFSGMMNYSPPMPTLQECERIQKVIKDGDNVGNIGMKFHIQCVQMTIVK